MPDLAMVGKGDGDWIPVRSKFGQNSVILAVFCPRSNTASLSGRSPAVYTDRVEI